MGIPLDWFRTNALPGEFIGKLTERLTDFAPKDGIRHFDAWKNRSPSRISGATVVNRGSLTEKSPAVLLETSFKIVHQEVGLFLADVSRMRGAEQAPQDILLPAL
ncbi:hypothetical protein Krac_3565 [Ktedonobacter racemifer DSM 44963]|uniref:Uncharacterized protein n=1 Tax=Ktedonobacter racemifer DSM 44963 TaxID=485913 RepID=D6U254_KTERA|nr:hypothetical protein Krac_3565 [Ktedonobacter racemifer DSM 44963]